ncbi:MAG TPA: S8/S53 family peptidase [Chitinophagaceae bacterium]|nr:S8/S53 family peptidase [Chitinophagaceae bacterium]
MKFNLTARVLFLVLGISLAHEKLSSQLAPYVIFSGPGPNPDGTATGTGTSLIGSSITINGVSPNGFKGAVGGVNLVQTTGSAVLKSHIYSWDKVIITNKNTIEGNIAAGNSSGSTGTVVSIGSNVNLTGDIHSLGNIVYAGGTFIGSVHVSGGTYLGGPTPISSDNNPQIPPQPTLPVPKNLSGYSSTTNFTTNADVYPIEAGQGVYNNVTFTGNKTLKFNGPGTYVFNSILMTGNTNKIVFDFQGSSTGKFYVYIKQNADLGKVDASTIGGSAAKIWIEVQGDGLGTSVANSSFIIANGSGGGSKIQSTIYATKAGITIGSGTGSGSTSLYGALYSKTAVNIQSGVTLNYVPFDDCTPIAANAGPDQTGASTCGLTTVTLAGNNPSPGTGQWSIVSGTGGSFGNNSSPTSTSPTSTFNGIAGSTYTLRWTIANSTCASSADDVVITFNKLPNSVDADPLNKIKIPLDFTGHASLTGAVSSDVTSITWTSTDGVPNSATTLNLTVASAGHYILTGTNAVGCVKSDAIEVTSKLKSIIGSELQSIYDNYAPGTFNTVDSFFGLKRINGIDYVTIDIICKIDTGLVIKRLTDNDGGADPVVYGLINILPNGLSKHTVTGDFPILNLPKLDALINILNYCRPYYRPFNNIGAVTSAGDTTIRSNLVRSGYELDGTGIKIGVISDSYRTVTDDDNDNFTISEPSNVIALDVPALDNDHVSDYLFGKRTDEGRAMIQIIHDIAPNAELFFGTGVYTAGHFAETVKWMAQVKGCKTIVDDVSYPAEPFLKDGIIAKTVNDVVSNNKVVYISAAGNFGKNAYESQFHGVTSSYFLGKKVHDFGGGDIFQKIRLKGGSSYMLVLQWADDFFSNDEILGTHFNVDFFLTKSEDGNGLIGFNRDNTEGDPLEFIPITIPPGPDQEYNVVIVNNTPGGDPARVKYIVFKNDIEFLESSINGQNASTIFGQGNATGAITIGAVRFNHIPGHPLLPSSLSSITKPQIESFSSIGGTYVNGEATPRLQPALAGVDGVNTTLKMGPDYPSSALDGWYNFFGTSAAAPHVAAATALILQGMNKYQGTNVQNVIPGDMKKLMQKTAVNMRPDNYNYNFDGPPDPTHYDFVAGAGLLDVDAAMRTFASPKPFEIRLIRPTNLIPCQDPFTLTIVGENFSDNSIVYLDTNRVEPIEPDSSIKIPYSYISKNRDTIRVTINTCIANPYIWVFTEPTDGLIVPDGGLSNGIRLFGQEIIVQTQTVTKKYGQNNPPASSITFTATLIDNGVPIPIAPADFATYGLDAAHLKTNTVAQLYTIVGSYPITVYRDFIYPVDTPLTNKYRYTFKSANLVIEKMPLKITPKVNNSTNATVFEGGYIGPVTFNYDFWKEQPAEPAVLSDVAKKFHEAFMPGNALAVVKDFKMAQTGGYVLSDADLENMSMMTTFKALKNSRKFKIENSKLVPETDPNSLTSQYLVDLASKSIFDYTINPKQATFYEGYPGITKKALLSKTALENYEGQVHPIINGNSSPTLVSLLNGSASATLAPLFNGGSTLAPLFNGNQVSIIDGKLATLSGGKLVAVPNSPSILYVNGTGGVGSLAYIINGSTSPTLAPLFNGAKIEMLDKSTITLNSANSYIKFENNDSAGLYAGNLQSMNNAISGTLAFILNGVQAPLPNYKDLQNSNGTLVNGSNTLAPLFNGSFIALNGTGGVGGLATLLNGGGVGGLAILLNGSYSATLAPLFNGNSTLASLLNGGGFTTLASIINNISLQFTNGATSATLAPLFNSSGGGGTTITDNNAVIVDQTDVDPDNANYLGALFGINMITGLELGQQTVVPGVLINPNFDITYVNSHVTIVVDPSCLHTLSTGKNFSSTTKVPTSLWLNLTTKVSGQLNADGKYLLFHNGTFELSSIDYTLITGGNLNIPDGIIIAKDTSQSPWTRWDGTKWITTVPVNFASNSDIFITGKILSSSNGFVKKNNNATTAVKGYFYTNSTFSDQWTYAMATYQPYFDYTDIDGTGDVVSINGNYRAGTPLAIVTNNKWSLVPGGSGGGGNNYTGSTLSWGKLTACPVTNSVITSSANSMIITMMESQSTLDKLSSFNLYPNPASNRINISFVPEVSGNSRIVLYTMDGKKAIEINNGIAEAGKSYLRTIDVGKLSRGVYLVQVWSGNKISAGKVVINR